MGSLGAALPGGVRSLGRDDGVAHRPRRPSEQGRAARRGGLWANAQRLRIPRANPNPNPNPNPNQVRSLAVNPSQLHLTDSTTYQRMLHGLSRLAEEISVELDLRTLRELQPLEELRQRLRGTDLGTDVTDL